VLIAPLMDSTIQDSGKSLAGFGAKGGDALFPYTIPLPAPPRGWVVLVAVGESGALLNGRVSGPSRKGFRHA
jgi:hypothetical protein